MTSDLRAGPTDALYAAGAEALANQYAPIKHGQLCPVWVNRAPIDRCDCWILTRAQRDARLVVDLVWTSMATQPHIEGAAPADTVLCAQVSIKGVLTDVDGSRRAALLFSAVSVDRQPQPTWLYTGTDGDIETMGAVAQNMATGAVRARRRERSR